MSEDMLPIETLTTDRMQPSQNPRRDARFHLHRSHFLEYVDLSKERGLEIGEFDLPLVEPSEGRCDLADWNTAEFLRDLAKRRPGHNPDYVGPVQFNHEIPGERCVLMTENSGNSAFGSTSERPFTLRKRVRGDPNLPITTKRRRFVFDRVLSGECRSRGPFPGEGAALPVFVRGQLHESVFT